MTEFRGIAKINCAKEESAGKCFTTKFENAQI